MRLLRNFLNEMFKSAGKTVGFGIGLGFIAFVILISFVFWSRLTLDSAALIWALL